MKHKLIISGATGKMGLSLKECLNEFLDFELIYSASSKELEIPNASMIIDFSEPDKSMFIISTGQSGHFLSKNYDNLTNLWKQGDYITISTNIPIILGGSKGKVIISPSLIK